LNEFDIKASEWDKNPMHWDRSVAITDLMREVIPLNKDMIALEYGAGTGIASFLLKDILGEITLMDNSSEMVRITNEKIISSKVSNIRALNFDLEKADYPERQFDLIFTQMVLHHVKDVENLLRKFYHLLKPGGFLAIADLYSEDGSFHGEDFTGHKGFEPEVLSEQIRRLGFKEVRYKKCFEMNKDFSDSETKKFNIFLLTGNVPL